MTQSKTKKCEAIILSTRPFSEKDRIVEFFAKQGGRATALAKSAATMKSRLRGHIEPTTHVELVLYRGKSLDLITEAHTLTSFLDIRSSYERIRLTGYLIQVLRNITVEHQDNPALFDILLKALAKLECGEPEAHVKTTFQTDILIAEGLWDLDTEITDGEFQNRINSYCGMRKL